MQECMEAVRRHSTPDDPWVAVSIRPDTPQSAVLTVQLIVKAATEETERLSKNVPGAIVDKLKKYLRLDRKLYRNLSERGVGAVSISAGGKREAADVPDSNLLSELVFIDSVPLLEKYHVVVFVDEAQNTHVGKATRGVMNCLHNPPKDISLVTAFFGLSDTQEVLRQCGLSQLSDERVVNLERHFEGGTLKSPNLIKQQ